MVSLVYDGRSGRTGDPDLFVFLSSIDRLVLGSMQRLLPFTLLAMVAASATRAAPPRPVIAFTFDANSIDESGRTILLRGAGRTLPNAVVRGTQAVKGVSEAGRRFREEDDTIWVRKPRTLTSSGVFAVSAWVRVGKFTRNNYVVASEDWHESEIRGFALRLSDDGVPDITIGRGEWVSARGGKVERKTWHHIVAMGDNKTLELWLDGKRVASEASGGSRTPSPFAMAIGRSNYDRKRGFLGDIDEVAIWNRTLKSEDVKAIYRRGKQGRSLLRKGDTHAPALRPDNVDGELGKKKYLNGKILLDRGEHDLLFVGASRKTIVVADGASADNQIEIEPPPSDVERFAMWPSVAPAANGQTWVAISSYIRDDSIPSVVYLGRIGIDGKLVDDWTALNKKLGIDTIASQAKLFPAHGESSKDGKALLVVTGERKGTGTIVVAEVDASGVSVVHRSSQSGKDFINAVYNSFTVGVTDRRPHLLTTVGEDYHWIDASGKKAKLAPCLKEAVASEYPEHAGLVANDGSAYLATLAPSSSNKSTSSSDTAPIVLARGTANGTLERTALGAHCELLGADLQFTQAPDGAVYLLAGVQDETCPFGRDYVHIAIWRVSGKRPERLEDIAIRSGGPEALAFRSPTRLALLVGTVGDKLIEQTISPSQ